MSERPPATLRRNVEQVLHCAREALSVVENDEPLEQAIEDLEQARKLIEVSVKRMRVAHQLGVRARMADALDVDK